MAVATNFDVSPFYRSSIGFDRVFNLLESASRLQTVKTWPPYDIIKSGDDHYCIVMAVPGFSQEELNLTFQPNLLIVSGERKQSNDAGYLHRGINAPEFEHRFELADHVRVEGAKLDKGMLSVNLVREVPEAMKPRQIAINAGSALPAEQEAKQIESKKAA